MSMTLSGNGTITGLVSGGLPDGTVLPADLSTGSPSWDTSGNLQFNSGYGSVATAYGCRAWVNFNGTGTVAIRASGNVSSITDNGTGNYTVNFTTAMPDGNGCVSFSAYHWFGVTANTTISGGGLGSNSAQVLCLRANDGVYYDPPDVYVSVFR